MSSVPCGLGNSPVVAPLRDGPTDPGDGRRQGVPGRMEQRIGDLRDLPRGPWVKRMAGRSTNLRASCLATDGNRIIIEIFT